LREQLFLRSNGECERGCGRTIELDTFHAAHLRAHANGGPEIESNLAAWCTRCNYEQGAADVADTRMPPREWQLEAHDQIVRRIIADGAATVSAAPGSGKTVFAALVFEALYAADVVDRMVVLAPRRTLVNQWVGALLANRHLQLKGNDALERKGQHGVVLTYQALLNPKTVETLRLKARQSRTLLVLDEVHHVGEPADGGAQPAWARSVADFAGTVDHDLHVAVLNLSGTLWRSNAGERISTVRYSTLPDGKLESLVDFEVGAERLIMAGQLRALDLYRLGAQVRMSDMTQTEVVDSKIADLDEKPARFVIASLAGSDDWRQSFVQSVLERLEQAHRSLDNYHAKALIVAARQEDARALQTEVNLQMRQRGLRPLADIATSDDDHAADVLERFKKKQQVGVLCTVDMAGEGYDCPDIVVVGYATNKLTTLYVRQVVARAMRVTERERELGRILPAAIVVPDVALLVDKLVEYLAPFMHQVYQADAAIPPGGEIERSDGQMPLLPRFQLEDITAGEETVTVAHIDGTRYDFQGELVARVARELEAVQLPPSFAPRVLVAAKRTVGDLLDSRPFEGLSSDAAALEDFVTGGQPPTPPSAPHRPHVPPTEAFDSIEARCKLMQEQLKRWESWWHFNGISPIAVFASEANRAAGISKGARPRADLAQLERALEHERSTIATLCQQTGAVPPRGLRRQER
jgi:superfamily II DNA or RNA helicase